MKRRGVVSVLALLELERLRSELQSDSQPDLKKLKRLQESAERLSRTKPFVVLAPR